MSLPTPSTKGYTSFRGRTACTCLAKWLPAFEAELLRRKIIKKSIDIYQLTGGAAASGGTHSQGGAFDIAQSGQAIAVARQMGADATWRRPLNWDGRGGMAHTHGVLRDCPHNGPARYQIAAVDAGYNGLGAGGHAAKDTGPRPLSHRTWEQGIAWAKAQVVPNVTIRPMQFNLPGEDKLPNPTDRIKAAALLVASAHPTFIGWNELVGVSRPGVASAFASQVDAALGADWHLVKPTKPLNENYISYNSQLLEVVEQYDDSILEAASGGRHLTRVVFKHKASDFVFAVGETQLVSTPGDATAVQRAVQEADRQKQGADALTSLQAVVAKHDHCPFIIQGDMNTHADLTALVKAGMKRTRKYADESTTRDCSTYTNYAKTKPSTNTDWIIDAQYVSAGFYVVGYTVVRRLHSGGSYILPRATDHDPIVSSIHPA